jgi:multidrug efflux pump
MLISLILIFFVLAAQFESFRDPFIILLGSVPLALSGALLFAFLGFTTHEYLQPGGPRDARRPGREKRDPDRGIRHSFRRRAAAKWRGHRSAGTRLRPILMTSVATVAGHFPLVLASGPWRGSRN